MADRYRSIVSSEPGRTHASLLGLPRPESLRRYAVGQPLLVGPALVGGVTGAPLLVSSTTGIAGNRGQASYAASKAGLIGMVAALSAQVAGRGITVNAVAPGFIETEMTARTPVPVREIGRRINSLGQGGQPVDVAETVDWLADKANGGMALYRCVRDGLPAVDAALTGQVIPRLWQSMLGA